MQYSIDYMPDKEIVSVKIFGRLTYQTAERYSKEAIKVARQNNCAKFLIDHADTTLQGGVHKLHTSEDELQQFGFTSTDRIAVLITAADDDSKLLKPVSHNPRWSALKYFSALNKDDAYTWLLETN